MAISKPTRITIVLQGLTGMRGIMFDRYPGSNRTELAAQEKMYLAADGKTLVLPSTNISSFLTAENTPSATKILFDSRMYKKMARSIATAVTIEEDEITFTRKGKPIKIGKFDEEGKDPLSGIYIHNAVARLPKGIPNPKSRPVLPTPWELTFHLIILPSKELNIQDLKRIFEEGGLCVGLGTFRPHFGKFRLVEFSSAEFKG